MCIRAIENSCNFAVDRKIAGFLPEEGGYNPPRKVGLAIAGYFGIGRKVRAPLGRMPANGWVL